MLIYFSMSLTSDHINLCPHTFSHSLLSLFSLIYVMWASNISQVPFCRKRHPNFFGGQGRKKLFQVNYTKKLLILLCYLFWKRDTSCHTDKIDEQSNLTNLVLFFYFISMQNYWRQICWKYRERIRSWRRFDRGKNCIMYLNTFVCNANWCVIITAIFFHKLKVKFVVKMEICIN